MSDNNNLPVIPTGEEMEEAAQQRYDLSENWLDLSINYPSPRFLLEYNGVGFSPLGGIQAITGHQKNGKTFVMCQLMAAILNPDSVRLHASLPGLTAHKETLDTIDQEEPVVLYCDTEQEIENTARVARRVHYLCGWDWNVGNPRFRVLWLRAEESVDDRWGKVKQAINEVRPTAIFLDGIRDVIGDFNDNAASSNLIAECMSIAVKMNCCMWCVLHENPGSEKMRGHLGTELANKVSDTFVSKKEKSAKGVTFKVSQVDARGKDVDDWQFEITDDAGGLGIPRILTASVTLKEADSAENIKKWLEDGQKEIMWPATGLEIKQLLKSKGASSNNDILQMDLKLAENRRFIIKQTKEEMEVGQARPKYKLNEDEFMPF